MKCRNISCHEELFFDAYWKICRPSVRLGGDYCYSVFIKLTLQEQYTLRKTKFQQYSYLLFLKYNVTNFLGRNALADILTEIRLYPKFKMLFEEWYVDYLVMHLIVDIAGALYPEDILRLFVEHLDGVDIETEGENGNIVFHSRIAIYNMAIDSSGKRKLHIPRYNSPDVDVLDEYDIRSLDVNNEFIGIMSDNGCLMKEIRPFRKTDIVPFTGVGLNELSMYIDNTFLVLQETYLEKILTNFEYELHQDTIYLSLMDYIFIYDIMPHDRLEEEVSEATLSTSLHFGSIVCACISSCHLLLNTLS